MKIKSLLLSLLPAVAAVPFPARTARAGTLDALRQASLSFEYSSAGKTDALTISNATDEVWIIESSTDLSNWSESGTVKVHNGLFRRALTEAPNQADTFYRVKFDPDRQDLLSDVANVLSLPVANFNYTHPALPPGFLVTPTKSTPIRSTMGTDAARFTPPPKSGSSTQI